jgi:ribosomal protein S18 acetylase RimI-like enzyme
LADADRAEIPAVVLSARHDNPAVRLCRRHGFVEVDRIVNRVGTESVKLVREGPAGRRSGPVG